MSTTTSTLAHPSEQILEAMKPVYRLAKEGRMEETIGAYRALVQEFPLEPAGWYALGFNLELMGHLEEAIPVYEKILELEPGHYEVIRRLGNCNYYLRRLEEAVKWYKQIQYLGTPTEALTIQARVAEAEPLHKRLAQRMRPILDSVLERIKEPRFLAALAAEAWRLPSNLGAIRQYGMGPYLTYLSRHYLKTTNYRFKRIPCDLCGSHRARGIFFDGPRKVIACRHCGFQTEERKPPDGRDVFNRTYERDDTIAGYQPIWTDPLMMEIRMKRIKDLFQKAGLPFPPPAKTRLVEIGCGQGTTLLEFRKLGLEGTGTETSQRLVDYTRTEYGLDVRLGTIRTLPFEPCSVDLFLSFHVLEHLDHPSDMFRQTHTALEVGGVLMLELPIPDLLSMNSGARYDPIYGYSNHEHINFFTAPIVKAYYSQYGFELLGSYEYVCGQHLMGGFLGRKKPG